MDSGEAERIVNRFLAAWERADVDELLDYFSDDARWQPGPMKPAVGKPALRESMVEWLAGARGLKAEVHHTVSNGSLVMHERTDRFTLGSREFATPVAAAFTVDNGRITAWREYFDMSPFVGPQSPSQATDATT
jgi:limonene-1,2-epoxide hydrolase